MRLRLNEDERLLRKTFRDFYTARSPVERVRALAEGPGHDPALWQEMAGLGWTGLPFPEELEGTGLDLFAFAILLEEAGRQLAPEPFLATVLLGGMALLHAPEAAPREAWLPKVAAGEALLALAFEEGPRFAPAEVATRAVAAGEGFLLSGSKERVLDGGCADAVVVSARAPEGVGLFLVAGDAPGLAWSRLQRVDGRRADRLILAETPAVVVAPPGQGEALLEEVLERATIGLCAEMLGGMSRAFEDTLAYLKSRVQFGVPIGSFQALQHRAARLFCALEMARSAVLAAARCADDPARRPALASLAKARCSDTYLHVGHEAVQMFGGAGMTDEVAIGLFLKRAAVSAVTFGDGAWHRARWAQLRGY